MQSRNKDFHILYVLENATARGRIPNPNEAAPRTEAKTASCANIFCLQTSPRIEPEGFVGFGDAQREEDMDVRNRKQSSRHTLPSFSWSDALSAAVLARSRPAGANTSLVM